MTETLMSARDYLASLDPPLAIKGARGRFSGPAKDRLAKEAANGMRFSDWPKTDTVVTKSAPGKKSNTVTVKAVTVNSVSYDTPPQVWQADETKFIGVVSKKETGIKEVCANCKRSLGWCYCHFPYALVGLESETISRLSRKTGRPVFPPSALTLPSQ